MFRLTLNFAGRAVRKFNFDKEAVCIGRDPECDVIIDNIGISRKHATIERANNEYILTDLKSHNGTFVRGQRIYHHQLQESDEFFIGKYSIQFENLEPAAPEPEVKEPKADGKALQDMTFRLDKKEIERIMGASATANVPKLALIAPEKEQRTIKLDQAYYLIGKNPAAAVPVTGFMMPDVVAVLVRDDKWFHLIAVSSRKKVRVNGKAVLTHQLSDGDTFEVAKRRFRFALA